MSLNQFSIPDSMETAGDVRSFIVDWLRRELVGPAPGYPLVQWDAARPELCGEEILRSQDPPRYRYGAGILFPRGVTYSGAYDPTESTEAIDASGSIDSAATVEEDPDTDQAPSSNDPAAETDADVEPAFTFLPSTMGLSFLARVSAPMVVDIGWGTYEGRKVAGYGAVHGASDKDQKLWFRQPGRSSMTLEAEKVLSQRQQRIIVEKQDGHRQLSLHVLSRPWGEDDDVRLMTITLINDTDAEVRNEACYFQCALEISCLDDAMILPYPDRPDEQSDAEELSLRLLYRHRPVFAVGHGCAADWKSTGKIGDGATSVRTEIMPLFEQAPVSPLDRIDGVDLSMRRIAESSDEDLIKSCSSLADEYETWISHKRAEVGADASLGPILTDTASGHLDQCTGCLARIRNGINILRHDRDAMKAFRVMNLAMVEQRAHYALSAEANLRRQWIEAENGFEPERPYRKPEYPYATAWRPFQLAFVLMNLAPFTHPEGSERDLVDVIWFPTGGGKTEAYLGLAAFSILHRRLIDPGNGGTTVLMRYTLRLLTTQQFQRAASLICALELVRRSDPAALGEEPFSIGLWLGGGVTPNRNADAIKDLARLGQGEGDNRFIVLACPWCGIEMGPKEFGRRTRVFGYEKHGTPAQARFRCEDPGCDFQGSAGLPLEVVDDRIYASPPTMVIGTVDKFAMMPWTPESRRLFGIGVAPAVSPPDLVIQDELHLIAGPLGSMVGHYETVVDELCARDIGDTRISAKIVASTATIARATEQVRALYNRDAILFPPQGLRAGESFFALERTDIPGRLYVGVLGSGLSSHVTSQIRTVAALLQAPALLQSPARRNIEPSLRDPYWTLMAYFNSLRELGRAATLIQADIREYLNAVWDRIGLRSDFLGEEGKALRRFINRDEELTSRLKSSDIPATLQKLFTALPSTSTVDLCLATNMIQVGLDVPRLSLMTIVGQPKSASEYIQASSRVGRDRDKPGLVVTNYNQFKPRDRSHFESFRSYHENVYRHVEPTSVTPFSIPVLERAIHALAVTLARFKDPALLNSPQAGISAATREMIRSVIQKRVRAVSSAGEDIAMEKLDQFLDQWNRIRPQSYGDFMGTDINEPLMWPAGKARPHDDWVNMKHTPSSMRNVDAESEAYLMRQYLTAGSPE